MGMHFQIFSLTVSFHLPFSNMAQIGPDARKNARAEGRRRTKISRYYVSGLIRKIVLLFILLLHLLFTNSVPMGSDTKRSRPQRRGIRFVYVEEIEVAGDKVDGPIWDEFVKSSRFDELGAGVTTRG